MTTLDLHSLQASDTIEQIIHWIRGAGRLALQYFDNVGSAYKRDRTLVTRADLEIEHLLAEQIGKAFPTHSFIGEESLQTAPDQLSDIVWVVDPIDGTTAFSHGLPGWGIAIGVLQAGKPLLGFYYMPLLDDLTYTSSAGVFCNNRRLRQTLRASWRQKGFLALSAGAHHDFSINIRHSRALGSNGTNLVYTARGSATAAFLPKAYLWDLVAGAAILERLGGELRYLDGALVNYKALLDGRLAPQPIIAGHANVLATLSGAIQLRQDSA
ncbi:MAG TPA: inositol monophosphatase family protein [Anaerolineae bacterium]